MLSVPCCSWRRILSADLFRTRKDSASATGDSNARPAARLAGDSIASREDVIARTTIDRESSRFAEALRSLDESLALAPEDGELVAARAATLFAWGRHREACAAYRRAAEIGTNTASLHAGLGAAHAALGQFDVAIAAIERAILIEPSEPHWRHLMGSYQEAVGSHRKAIAVFKSIIAVDPSRLEARIGLCKSLLSAGDPARCAIEAQRIVDVHPKCAEACVLLGIAEFFRNRPEGSLQWLARAEAIAGPDSNLEVFEQISVALSALGRDRECVEMLEKRLQTRPNLNAHLAYSTALLAEGRFIDGWRQFEMRWFAERLAPLRPNFGKPVWGGQDLTGKSLLVRAEQGFGDVFQMLRYLPLLKERGARVLLLPIPEFKSMYATLEGVDAVLDADRSLPDFDYWVPLMSLPRIFATTLASIPAKVPYIAVVPELRSHWRSRLGEYSGTSVGIVWAGRPTHVNDANRSIPIASFASLLRIPHVRFVGLQHGEGSAGRARGTEGANFLDLGPELRDFGDTAAIVDQLDLLISVDTAAAHVGGALGKPVWLLLPEPAEYRWLKQREDTPWYPTVRLFRQRRPRDWGEVVERVASELARAAGLRANGGAPEEFGKLLRPEMTPRAVEGDAARLPPGIAVAAETRSGLMQFDPCRGTEGRSLDWYGEYLHPMLETVVGLVRPGETVLEAGSGYGAHAIVLGRVLGPQGHLMVYENDPVARRMLVHNLAANCPHNVTVVQRPLGSARPGRPHEGAHPQSIDAEPADCDSVDGLRLERLDWLKINAGVDAHAVLDGASESLWRLRPRLLVCTGGKSQLPAMAEFCASFGYRAWCVEARYFQNSNFNCRSNDIFDGDGIAAVLAIPEEVDASVGLESLAPA